MARKRGNGEGSIYKNGKYWAAQVTIGKNKQGNPKRVTISGKTRAEVAEKLKIKLVEQQQQKLVTPSRIKVKEWLQRWLNDKKYSLKRRTWETYVGPINNHVNPEIGQVYLQKLTAQTLEAMYAKKIEEGLSPSTVRRLHTIIHGALKKAQRQNLVVTNVSELCELPKLIRKRMRVLNEDEVHMLLQAALEHRLYAALLLELGTGMRRAELLAIKWENIDFENGSLSVVESLVELQDGTVLFEEPKTLTSIRNIALPESVIKELRRHRVRQEQEKCEAAPYEEHGLVFCTSDGKPLRPSNFSRIYRDIWLKKAGLTNVRFHDLRHTHATLLLKACQRRR